MSGRTVVTDEAQLPAPLSTLGARLLGYELRGLDLRGRTLQGLVLGERGGAGSALHGVDLSGATLRGCSLVGVELRDVWLRDAVLEHCDLRYADIERTQLTGARLIGCDLYRARLGPVTIMDRARLLATSINEVHLDGASLDRGVIGARLLQESPEAFATFHAGIDDEPDERAAHSLAHREAEAARIYRSLSGYWDGRGRHLDAAWAYVRARRCETRHGAPWQLAARVAAGHEDGEHRPLVAGLRALPRWLTAVTSDAVAGHGERPLRTVGALVVLALVFAAVFAATGHVAADPADAGLGPSLLASVQVLTTTLPGEHVRSSTGAWLVAVETGVGILLLGLLGFVLGNRMRQH